MRWIETPVDPTAVPRLVSTLGVSRIIATILAQRGLAEPEAAQRFLSPKLKDLECPFGISHLDAAVDRLRLALRERQNILVFGDYDVDGVTSTTLLVSSLQALGVCPRFTVPRRLEEGYGLSRAALERALEDGQPDLLVAVDCGTNSVAEVAWLRERGVDVLILDHHTSREARPADCVIVNPHLFDQERGAPWQDLCTVGLVFKVVHGLLKRLKQEGDEAADRYSLKDQLDLVAMGTIADLVPLRGENRILAKAGLRRLQDSSRLGLGALFEVAGLEAGVPVTPFDVSFRLSPRINASGRLADASMPIAMLLGTDWTECCRAARQLDAFNRERQEIERKISEEAERRVLELYADDPVLVLYDENWHPGVVGIVASRLVSKFHRPSLVLGAEGALAKGSGRSIPGINLVDVLAPLADRLKHWGGHPMAVGVTVDPSEIDGLRAALTVGVSAATGGERPEPEVNLAAWLEETELTEAFLTELECLHPFGQGNPEPIFGLARRVFRYPLDAFGQGHLRGQVEVQAGRRFSLVAWKQALNPPPAGVPVDLAVRVGWNVWNGRKSPQLNLVAWRESR